MSKGKKFNLVEIAIQYIKEHTSVPAMPMARPMSDSCNAGASLVPSPVTATTSPNMFLKLVTNVCLSRGNDLAMTCIQFVQISNVSIYQRIIKSGLCCHLQTWILGMTSFICSGVILRKSDPSMAIPSAVSIPHSLAIALAVFILSPVTIRTDIPAA